MPARLTYPFDFFVCLSCTLVFSAAYSVKEAILLVEYAFPGLLCFHFCSKLSAIYAICRTFMRFLHALAQVRGGKLPAHGITACGSHFSSMFFSMSSNPGEGANPPRRQHNYVKKPLCSCRVCTVLLCDVCLTLTLHKARTWTPPQQVSCRNGGV